MVWNWTTMIVLGFGIVVAVIGVSAYLRMFRKNTNAITYRSDEDIPPPIGMPQAASDDGKKGKD